MMFYKLQQWWNKNGYTIIFISAFLLLTVFYLFRSGGHGTSDTKDMNDILLQVMGENKKITTPRFLSVNRLNEYDRVMDGPTSQKSKGEQVCKEFLEFLYKKPFDTTRPSFMTNPITGHALELDLYNAELRIAVEYNGAQHYHFNEYMHKKSRDKFQNMQYRDYMKKQLCHQHGINLIIVPYTIKTEEIPTFIYKQLKLMNLLPEQK